QWLVCGALLSVLLLPYFLPGMHERYFYAADVFSLIYVFYRPQRWWAACLIQLASAFTYLPYLFDVEPLPRECLAVAITAAIVAVAIDFIKLHGRAALEPSLQQGFGKANPVQTTLVQ